MTTRLDREEHTPIERLVPELRRLAQWARRRAPSIDFDDLFSVAQERAVTARASWLERKRSGSFNAYALRCAYFAMIRHVRTTLEVRGLEEPAAEILAPFEDEPREGALLSPLPSASHDWRRDRTALVRELRGRVGGFVTTVHCGHVNPANDGEDAFLDARAMRIGRAVIDATAASFGEPDRTYFVRHFHEGKNLEEIAAELGVTRKAARVIADRVHDRLADAIRAAKVG